MSNGEVNVVHSLPFDILRFLVGYSAVDLTPSGLVSSQKLKV